MTLASTTEKRLELSASLIFLCMCALSVMPLFRVDALDAFSIVRLLFILGGLIYLLRSPFLQRSAPGESAEPDSAKETDDIQENQRLIFALTYCFLLSQFSESAPGPGDPQGHYSWFQLSNLILGAAGLFACWKWVCLRSGSGKDRLSLSQSSFFDGLSRVDKGVLYVLGSILAVSIGSRLLSKDEFSLESVFVTIWSTGRYGLVYFLAMGIGGELSIGRNVRSRVRVLWLMSMTVLLRVAVAGLFRIGRAVHHENRGSIAFADADYLNAYDHFSALLSLNQGLRISGLPSYEDKKLPKGLTATLFSRALEKDQRPNKSYRFLSELYLRDQDLNAAREVALRALGEILSHTGYFSYVLGTYHQNNGDLDSARVEYEQALAKDEHHLETYAALASCYKQMNLEQASRDLFDKLQSLQAPHATKKTFSYSAAISGNWVLRGIGYEPKESEDSGPLQITFYWRREAERLSGDVEQISIVEKEDELTLSAGKTLIHRAYVENLIENGGFEDYSAGEMAIDGWAQKTIYENQSRSFYSIEKVMGLEEEGFTRSLVFEGQPKRDGLGRFTNSITFDPFQPYVVGSWVRGTGHVMNGIEWYAKSGGLKNFYNIVTFDATTEWNLGFNAFELEPNFQNDASKSCRVNLFTWTVDGRISVAFDKVFFFKLPIPDFSGPDSV